MGDEECVDGPAKAIAALNRLATAPISAALNPEQLEFLDKVGEAICTMSLAIVYQEKAAGNNEAAGEVARTMLVALEHLESIFILADKLGTTKIDPRRTSNAS